MQASKWTVTYKIDHVGRKERGAGLLEEGLVGIEHAIEPWEKLLSAFWLSARTGGRDRIEPQVLGATHTVVGVENDGNAVDGSDGADVVGGSNGTGDGSLLLLSGVLHALAGEVGSATLAGLETIRMSTPSRALFSAGCILHDGRLRLLGSLEGSDNGARERQSACFLQKDRPWLFRPQGGCIGLSGTRNLEPATRSVPPTRGLRLRSTTCAREPDSVWEGPESRSSHEPRAGDVAGGDGELLLAGIGEELEHVVPCCPVNLPVSFGIGSGGFEP